MFLTIVVVLGWTPGAHRAALSLTLLNWAGEEKILQRTCGSRAGQGDHSAITAMGKTDSI